MILSRLQDTGVRRLHQLFSPSGMPVVRKVPDAAPTTSVAVRGGAGVGKTTLALALALALAREPGGAVLHLTTELDPIEVHLKAGQLGLPEGSVVRWGAPGSGHAQVLATHLELHRAEVEPQTPAERKFGALQLVWDLLHPEDGTGAFRPERPVRAIVIDAFSAPQPEESQEALRRDLVALVQSLEGEGISVVLIEETLGDAPSWVPFVVDIVLELSWAASSDTGELARKLRCTKSRHAMARPGPHDYGVEDGTALSVWPDVLAAVSPEIKTRVAEPLRMAHMIEDQHCVFFTEGAILLAPTDGDGWRVETVLRNTPGSRVIDVRCGAVTTIHERESGIALQWTEDRGIAALGWMITDLLREKGNAVILREPHLLLRRAHFAPGLLGLIHALEAMGGLVILGGATSDLRAFSGLSTVPRGDAVYLSRIPSIRDEPYRTSAWRTGLSALLGLLDAEGRIRAAVEVTARQVGQRPPSSGLDALAALEREARGASRRPPNEVQRLLERATSGVPAGLEDLTALLPWWFGWRAAPMPHATPAGALVNLLLGWSGAAYKSLYQSGRVTWSPGAIERALCAAFAAVRAGNRAAMRYLQALSSPFYEIFCGELLRAVGIWEGESRMGHLLEFMTAREHRTFDAELRALEARMWGEESPLAFPLLSQSVLGRMAKHNETADMLADAHFNLGLTAERLGLQKEARAAYEAAVQWNSILTEARSRIARFERNPPDLTSL